MKARWYRCAALGVAAALMLGSAGAAGNGVVLVSGVKIAGRVQLGARQVYVGTEHGMLSISRDRVAEVTVAGAETVLRPVIPPPQEPVRPAGEQPKVRLAAPTRSSEQPKLSSAPGRASRSASLGSRIDVDFDETPLTDVMDFLRETTGVAFVYRASDMPAEATPVTLRLKNVTARTVLNLALEGSGLTWRAQKGFVRVLAADKTDRTELRVYDVRDLLGSEGDRGVPGVSTLAAPAANGGSDWEGGWEAGGGGRQSGGAGPSCSDRAYALALLITQTVRPRSWAKPAVRSFSGSRQRSDGQGYDVLSP